jgi:predicted homoserine dehydrogenase-like protein
LIIVDSALKAREAEGRPIRVGIVGAGFMGQGLTNQIVNSVPGMRVVGISNRRPERAADAFRYAGVEPVAVDSQNAFDDAAAAGGAVVTDEPFLLC